MTDLSNKSLLVCDGGGLFLSFALRMAQEGGFGVVHYHNHWSRGRPNIHELKVGKGYDGIKLAPQVWPIIDKVDVIAFPDCSDGDWQVYLREQGKKVWGSGKGAELEQFRLFAKKMMEAVGLPVGPYTVVKGLSKLREYLQENDDLVIKVSFWRGLMETRKHEKYWLSKPFLDGIESDLGPDADEQEFVVEEKIDTKLEIGFDSYFANQFPSIALNACEIKDAAYLGVVQKYDDLPQELREINDALAPVLKRFKYANFFSHEDRVAEDGTAYPIDLTCRMGSPSGEAQLKTWKNLPQIVYAGAHGEFIEPEFEKPFVAQAMIFNAGDEDQWCPVGVPKSIRDSVSLYFGMRKGAEDYIVPQQNPFDEIGSVIATGDTAEEAIAECKNKAGKIEGHVTVKTEALDDALKEFALMEKKGMSVAPIEV